MRGTLSSCDKLTGDFGNGAGATRIGDRNMLCIYLCGKNVAERFVTFSTVSVMNDRF
jgi:hypothetical protein